MPGLIIRFVIYITRLVYQRRHSERITGKVSLNKFTMNNKPWNNRLRKAGKLSLLIFLYSLSLTSLVMAQSIKTLNDSNSKTISFGNQKLKLTLDYNRKANISLLEVNGQKVMEGKAGIYSEIKTASGIYNTLNLSTQPIISIDKNIIKIKGIRYGDKDVIINETWEFITSEKDVKFNVERSFSNPATIEEASIPSFNFSSINTWEGAYQGYGGLAWFYLFNEKLATYGVHTNSSKFWNSKTGNGLSVLVDAPGKQVAMKYSRTNNDQLAYGVTVSDQEMIPRYDAGTNRKRFIRQNTNVWSAFRVSSEKTTQKITLSYFDFDKEYGRGKFVGMNGQQVSSVLNTIARIGVIDAKHFGGNSWHTPYGPICLHEQYIAQLGLAINDNSYLQGYQECLDFYRDNAIKPDGRVWARWAYNNVDIMPGEVTDKGFYEAQWGYLMDSNPDLVTNVAELFDQTGDIKWVKTHQLSSEKALDYIIKRDSDGDGLVEMMTDSYKDKRGSDWIDIIWAAYENAFVNAKLYFALTKWAVIEHELNNDLKAKQYEDFAAKLKRSFNKPTTEGGFWDEEKQCYVHWLDKDKSVHGRNMVTPVNFMAIAYGICDDEKKTKIILDNIETQMQQEKLFFWPLTMSSYAPGEGKEEQFPFPFYENGDLFLSWGAVAVKAYANYKPELALKYVRNVMERHSKDGLAYQRYGRVKQDGLGDDILSGNSLSVVGLYQAIYGINPLYNRFYLNPHITKDLAGTIIKYNYRDQKLDVGLEMSKYSVSNGKHQIISKKDFGFFSKDNKLFYFNGYEAKSSLIADTKSSKSLILEVKDWSNNKMVLNVSSTDNKMEKINFSVYHLTPNTSYNITRRGKKTLNVKSDAEGKFTYGDVVLIEPVEVVISKQ